MTEYPDMPHTEECRMPFVSKSQYTILALLSVFGGCAIKESVPQDAPGRISYAATGEDCCGEVRFGDEV